MQTSTQWHKSAQDISVAKTPTVFEISTGGIVYKKENNVLLWLLVKHKGAGHWGFPKGHIGDLIKDERMEDAALREVREEGGITAKIIHNTPLVTQYYFRRGHMLHNKSVYYFLMKYISGETKDHDDEVSDAKFVEEEELPETLTFEIDKKAFKELKNNATS